MKRFLNSILESFCTHFMVEEVVDAPNQFNITILLQNGTSALFQISKNDTVSELKKLIEQSDKIEIPEGKSTKLLYLGHVLEDTSKLADIQKSSCDEFTVHCFFKQQISDMCPESPSLDLNTEEPHGFDRLRRMNYSQQQIRNIRQQFHRMLNSNHLTPEQQIDVEEEWLPALFNSNETTFGIFSRINRREDEMPLFNQQMHHRSTNTNLFIGFCIGIIFGVGIILIFPLFYHEKRLITGVIFGILIRYTSKLMILYS